MIPKIIHYCWFGRGPMPELALKCIESWHKYMPDWKYKLWNEENFDIYSLPYTREAYEYQKYAFVSDFVRLNALYEEGGLYLDVDFEVYRPFDDLIEMNDAFAGFEGSKYLPVMMGVCASCAGGKWVKEMRDSYSGRHFVINGHPDCTPNVTYLTNIMHSNGLIQNGVEQYYRDLHIYPVDYFCPKQTTGEYLRTNNTFCESKGVSSWDVGHYGWKSLVKYIVGKNNMIKLIKCKRRLFG